MIEVDGEEDVPDQGTQWIDLPSQSPPPLSAANNHMDKDSHPAEPTDTAMGLTEENQEGEFHTPTLRVNQAEKTSGTNATMQEKDLYVQRFDVMLDIGSIYADAPFTWNVAEKGPKC